MTKYLITFPSDAMDHIPQEEIADVAKAAHVCCQELIDAGAYVLVGGLTDQPSSIVGTGGAVRTVRDLMWSAESRSWTCPHATRSRQPATVHRRFGK